MGSGASLRDASRHRVNQHLTPLDIEAGGDRRVLWQGPGYGRREEVGGGEKGVARDTRTSEHDQVPLGRPLCSGHPNVGVGRIGGERGVASEDQNWGHKSCLGAEGRQERVMGEAQHEAGPSRGRGIVALALS